jgi:hypothetical protein
MSEIEPKPKSGRRAPLGRPTKLTPAIQETIASIIRSGNYLSTAAATVGIGNSTIGIWMQRGDSDPEEHPDWEIYRQFRDAVEGARAEAERRFLGIIADAAGDGTWQAAAWFLERSAPQRWGRFNRIEVTGADGGPVQVEHRATLMDKLAGMRERASEIIDADSTDTDETGLRAIG